jgi:hypothetical protein
VFGTVAYRAGEFGHLTTSALKAVEVLPLAAIFVLLWNFADKTRRLAR